MLVNESHKEVGWGSVELITGISNSVLPALQIDTKSSTLLSDSSVKTNGFTTETSATKSDAVAGHDVSVGSLTRASPISASNLAKCLAKELDLQNKTQEIKSLQAQLAQKGEEFL